MDGKVIAKGRGLEANDRLRRRLWMERRQFLAGCGMALLAWPAITHAQSAQVLKFVSSADLGVVGPVWRAIPDLAWQDDTSDS